MKSKPKPEAIRHRVQFEFHSLNWDFIKLMADIAGYAAGKYGSATQYTGSRLEGDRSPVNHMADHIRLYLKREPHDHFNDLDHQLAAIAYNAMMEYYYLHRGGPTAIDDLYREP